MSNNKKAEIDNLLIALNNEKIITWFDLGLFIDRFKEQESKSAFRKDAKSFDAFVEKGGVAFITFYFAIDGITVETEKYAKAITSIYPEIPIHFVAGEIKEEALLYQRSARHGDARRNVSRLSYTT